MIYLLQRMLAGTADVLKMRWTLVFFFLFAMLCYSSSGYMFFELEQKPDLEWADAIWWAVVTMTTVGYGDYFPETVGGRLWVGVPTMIVGVSLLGYILSMFASTLMEMRLKEVRGMGNVDLNDHIIVCRYHGLGSALKLVEEIRSDPSTKNMAIVLVDPDLEELPHELKTRNVHYVKGDPARAAVLERANLGQAHSIIILRDANHPGYSDHINLAVALTVERTHPDVLSVVHCVDPENRVHFQRANCDSIVCLGALSSQMLVQELQDPGVHSVFSELTTNLHGKQCYIVEVQQGVRTFDELRTHCSQAESIVMGIRRGDENMLAPAADLALESGDRAIVIAAHRPSL